MATVYKYEDFDRVRLTIETDQILGTHGVEVHAGLTAFIPDDQIPDLVAALQNYMSRRANEMTKAAKRG